MVERPFGTNRRVEIQVKRNELMEQLGRPAQPLTKVEADTWDWEEIVRGAEAAPIVPDVGSTKGITRGFRSKIMNPETSLPEPKILGTIDFTKPQ